MTPEETLEAIADGIESGTSNTTNGPRMAEAIRALLAERDRLREENESQAQELLLRYEQDPEIEKLKEENERHKRWHRKPTHGPCCTCQKCGQDYDTCRCDLDEVAGELEQAEARIKSLEAALRRAESALCDGLLGGKGEPLPPDKDSCWLSVAYANAVLKDIRRALAGGTDAD